MNRPSPTEEGEFAVQDEYDALDEQNCNSEDKLLVKEASKVCNRAIRENSNL